jgi:hypothetical protein
LAWPTERPKCDFYTRDPGLLATFTEPGIELFFAEPVMGSRLERHRERLVEIFGIPIEVMRGNAEMGLKVLTDYRTQGLL